MKRFRLIFTIVLMLVVYDAVAEDVLHCPENIACTIKDGKKYCHFISSDANAFKIGVTLAGKDTYDGEYLLSFSRVVLGANFGYVKDKKHYTPLQCFYNLPVESKSSMLVSVYADHLFYPENLTFWEGVSECSSSNLDCNFEYAKSKGFRVYSREQNRALINRIDVQNKSVGDWVQGKVFLKNTTKSLIHSIQIVADPKLNIEYSKSCESLVPEDDCEVDYHFEYTSKMTGWSKILFLGVGESEEKYINNMDFFVY
ncbi:hypothetical protein D5R81_08700 [Parashewanella spongiae]|uniref:Uncharacterized protein n=1 Tax=Parashewanella spongiae TaxID=342950 RepID=A0A3A6TYM7_9GAMM|nr:hypothetical protein [Parashewanella spongiae]MCL1077965.1 hypothetical protein [Parashewanella spongiae]RJY16910.1 hypothetical protein D5R81_08700 [Parashewanella spongiae]